MPDLRHTDIQYLHGVGPKRAELLKKELGISTYYDLLYYFPYRYIDRSVMNHVNELNGDEAAVQLKGRFLTFNTVGEGRKRRLQALFTDGTGTIEVVWFNRVASIQKTYNTNTQYILFGKPSLFNNHLNIVHPEVDVVTTEQVAQGLTGVYSLTEVLRNRSFTSRAIHKLILTLLETPAVQYISETLPPELLHRYRLMPLAEALRNIHVPADQQSLQRAQLRLKFEELFFLELNILHYIKGSSRRLVGHVFGNVGAYFNGFYHNVLQFPLTGAQKRVIREMRHDMGSGKQMNRLLQGDVGSGKTIVAFMTALIALDNGYQACIMAPTEILAGQHLETIKPMADAIGVKVALLTGSTRKRERTAIHESLMNGELQILIGTHALIEDTVQFHNLGLAIIDEQHRFGVAQRARLWSKNRTAPPHVLVMTATPIPRTLAMTVYGDLDVSVIDELPPGRKPVTTLLRHEPDRFKMYQFVGGQLKQGRQAYIVYPLIEENEKLDLHALEQGFEQVKDVFPHYNVAMVHGRMKPAEKDHQMMLFASGKAHILVATTVIEVGVNVPNASVMVIEDAERFGLSQLHQLRGRVGRGADQSYCILMARSDLGRDTRHRLQVMTQTNDGFVVAEEDMKLRGPGDMEGTQQSGIAFNLHIANLAQDGQIIQLARNAAEDYLRDDPKMETPWGLKMAAHMREIYNKQANWGLIS
jgi:ATP-dependent DNA helicase RecG